MKNDKIKDKRKFKKWMFPWLLCALLSDIMFFRDLYRDNMTTDL